MPRRQHGRGRRAPAPCPPADGSLSRCLPDRRALAIPLDLSDADAVESAAFAIASQLGPTDVWVNNAMMTVFSPVGAAPDDQHGLYLAIGTCALVPVIVHFRCFLHIDPPRQNVDNLHPILFSGLLFFFMIAGTLIRGTSHAAAEADDRAGAD